MLQLSFISINQSDLLPFIPILTKLIGMGSSCNGSNEKTQSFNQYSQSISFITLILSYNKYKNLKIRVCIKYSILLNIIIYLNM